MASKHQTVKLEFAKREGTGKGTCRKLRSKDQLPVVLYGPEYKNGLAGVISARAVAPVANSAHRETTLIELDFADGGSATALIRDVQRHPLTRRVIHIDFYQVLKGHMIKVEVPIRVINEELCKGIKDDGGVLVYGERAIEICEKWGVPYVDLYKNSGLNTFLPVHRDMFTCDSYGWGRGDCTHPNEKGYRLKYMPLIESAIKSI